MSESTVRGKLLEILLDSTGEPFPFHQDTEMNTSSLDFDVWVVQSSGSQEQMWPIDMFDDFIKCIIVHLPQELSRAQKYLCMPILHYKKK